MRRNSCSRTRPARTEVERDAPHRPPAADRDRRRETARHDAVDQEKQPRRPDQELALLFGLRPGADASCRLHLRRADSSCLASHSRLHEYNIRILIDLAREGWRSLPSPSLSAIVVSHGGVAVGAPVLGNRAFRHSVFPRSRRASIAQTGRLVLSPADGRIVVVETRRRSLP